MILKFYCILFLMDALQAIVNSQTILGRNLNHDLQHQIYHEMLYRFIIVWYHSLFAFCCFIFGVVGFAGRGDRIKRFEYHCLAPTVVTSSQLQCFSILQLIEHYDVKIFLILAPLSWATRIQATPVDCSKYHEPSQRPSRVNPIASDTRSLEPLRMLWEGSSASTSADDVPNKAGGFPLARRVPIGRKESLK